MSGYRILFEDLKVGRKFEKNGNFWIKKSTRTAGIIYPSEHSGRWFYFKNHDLVTIGIDSLFISVRDELFQADADIQKTLSKILTDEA